MTYQMCSRQCQFWKKWVKVRCRMQLFPKRSGVVSTNVTLDTSLRDLNIIWQEEHCQLVSNRTKCVYTTQIHLKVCAIIPDCLYIRKNYAWEKYHRTGNTKYICKIHVLYLRRPPTFSETFVVEAFCHCCRIFPFSKSKKILHAILPIN